MSDWSKLERLPGDVITQRTADFMYAVHSDLAAGFRAAGYGAETRAELATSDLAGRRPLGELVVDSERFVVRRFSHGGLLRWLTGRRYLDPLRPFRELVLARRLNEAGVRVPEVVAACARRNGISTWELELVSRRVESSIDLGTLILRDWRGIVAARAAAACAQSFGQLVARMHELGFLHADLTPRNVLVETDSLESGSPRLWILDLDGSRFVRGLTLQERAGNIGRLWRHVARMQRAGPAAKATRWCARFLKGYEPLRAERKTLLRLVAQNHRRTSGWHALAEFLERSVGARRGEPQP